MSNLIPFQLSRSELIAMNWLPDVPNTTDFVEYQPLLVTMLEAPYERFNGSKVTFVRMVSEVQAKVWWDAAPQGILDCNLALYLPIANLRYSKRCPEGHAPGASCLRCKGVGVVECSKSEQEFDVRHIHPKSLKKFVRIARENGYVIPD